MIIVIRWVRLAWSYCLLAFFIFSALNYKTCVYLYYQAKGQLHILMNTESIADFASRSDEETKSKLRLVSEIKRYSTDSLGYKPTRNFTSIYDQKDAPVLWVLTVCEPYQLKAYEWRFPIVGSVSYKGFFKKELAQSAVTHYKSEGYDAGVRSVSAWSTLGWFSDPVLSNTLKRSKGNLCNLFFHELFHATYYVRSSVNFNENIASFIAHKATLQFLKNDSLALKEYIFGYYDNEAYSRYMLRKSSSLLKYYASIKNHPQRLALKLKAIREIADSLKLLGGMDSNKYEARVRMMYRDKNAYFIDFEQYDSMQDSLEEVFNKFYKGDLKKMVRDLRHKAGNY
jgi:predicted aminopeptidase